MSDHITDDVAVSIAKEIARKALEGDYDLLLAARDLYDLRDRLPSISSTALADIVDIASEVDELPLGNERQYWAADALQAKDLIAADYRTRVSAILKRALQELLDILDKAGHGVDSP